MAGFIKVSDNIEYIYEWWYTDRYVLIAYNIYYIYIDISDYVDKLVTNQDNIKPNYFIAKWVIPSNICNFLKFIFVYVFDFAKKFTDWSFN